MELDGSNTAFISHTNKSQNENQHNKNKNKFHPFCMSIYTIDPELGQSLE